MKTNSFKENFELLNKHLQRHALLTKCPKFMEVFGVKNGDGMYRDPSKQIVIW